MTDVIRQAGWQQRRVCTHDHRGFVRYICHDSREQIRRACLDCGRTIGQPEKLADHPDRHTYPQLVQHADDGTLERHVRWDPVAYDEYLASPQWAERREYFVGRALNRCQVCNESGGPGGRGLDVHHRTYARLGAELDTDVTVLCRGCHTIFHQAGKLRSQAA